MTSHPPKPVCLRPMDKRQKRWFIAFLVAGILMVLVGWIFTITSAASSSIPGVRSVLGQEFKKAAAKLQDVQASAQKKASLLSQSVEEAQKAYQEEKNLQRQEESLNPSEKEISQ